MLLYLGLFAVMTAGYLISTAEGVGIPVFGLFEVPALISSLPDQADVAGVEHLWLAWAVVIFAGLHGQTWRRCVSHDYSWPTPAEAG